MRWQQRSIGRSLFGAVLCLSAAAGSGQAAQPIPVQESLVLSAAWGSGPDDLGVATPSEANPEGPMSFALGADGTLFVLDQRNRRIQVFADGKRRRSLPLERETWIDLDAAPDGGLALLDAAPPGEVRLLAASGETRFSTPLEGKLIPRAAEVIQIQVVPAGAWAGVWAVVNAGQGPSRSVRLAGGDGSPLPRVSVPGLFAADGDTLLDVAAEGDRALRVTVYEKGSFSNFRQVRVASGFIYAVRGVWRDRKGNFYVIAAVSAGQKAVREEVVVLGADLRERGRFPLPAQQAPHEVHRPFRVDPNGAVFQMIVGRDGRVRVRKFAPSFP